MRKINLKAKHSTSASSVVGGPSGKISLVAGLVLVIITLSLAGVVFYLQSSMEDKISSAKNDIQALKRRFDTNKDFKELYDFQERLLEIEKLVKKKKIQTDVLTSVSQGTLGVTTVDNLKVDMKEDVKVDINFRVPGLAELAEQINAYKGLTKDNEVGFGGSSLKNDVIESKVDFLLNMKQSIKTADVDVETKQE